MAEHSLQSLQEQQKDNGRGFFIYGETGTGKTASIVTLANYVKPKETIIYPTEPKSPIEPLKEAYPNIVNDLPIFFRGVDGEFKTAEDVIVDINNLHEEIKGGRQVGAVTLDSMSFESVLIKLSLEDSRFSKENAKVDGKWKYDPWLEKTMVDRPEWGALGSWLTRLTNIFVELTKRGVIVVSTSTSERYPKWGNGLDVGPDFQGKQYPQTIHGFFSHIGYVVAREDGKYPSLIQFMNMPDSKFKIFARCDSAKLREKCLQNGGLAPLDFSKILKVIDG
jgi:hypothetical protein